MHSAKPNSRVRVCVPIALTLNISHDRNANVDLLMLLGCADSFIHTRDVQTIVFEHDVQ